VGFSSRASISSLKVLKFGIHIQHTRTKASWMFRWSVENNLIRRDGVKMQLSECSSAGPT
jgi:hypothetical protein